MKKTILRVADCADDEALTLRALARNGIANDLVVARDSVEALDCLFATGPHMGTAASASRWTLPTSSQSCASWACTG